MFSNCFSWHFAFEMLFNIFDGLDDEIKKLGYRDKGELYSDLLRFANTFEIPALDWNSSIGFVQFIYREKPCYDIAFLSFRLAFTSFSNSADILAFSVASIFLSINSSIRSPFISRSASFLLMFQRFKGLKTYSGVPHFTNNFLTYAFCFTVAASISSPPFIFLRCPLWTFS